MSKQDKIIITLFVIITTLALPWIIISMVDYIDWVWEFVRSD